MRFLQLIPITLILSLSLHIQGQNQPEPNASDELQTFTKPVELQESAKPEEITPIDEGDFLQDKGHSYTCGRCGSENHLDWRLNFKQGGMGFIPHCQFCGKKYWPKFKPSNAIKRTYCHNITRTSSCQSS